MSCVFNGDFARLTPLNNVARRGFSKAFAYVEQHSSFHLAFMSQATREHTLVSDEPVESSTDYDTHPDTEDEGDSGQFILSFNEKRWPGQPRLGWRAGKGRSNLENRNVDLLLMKPGDHRSKSLASIHMIFQFNQTSGLLMLVNGSSKASLEYNLGDGWQDLEYSKRRLLHQRSVSLKAGQCEYAFEYTVREVDREDYWNQRDRFLALTTGNEANAHPSRRIPPGGGGVQRGRYIELGTQGSGTFGWVSKGADTQTGDLIAIKELRIRDWGARQATMNEVKMGKRFIVSWTCSTMASRLTQYRMNRACSQL